MIEHTNHRGEPAYSIGQAEWYDLAYTELFCNRCGTGPEKDEPGPVLIQIYALDWGSPYFCLSCMQAMVAEMKAKQAEINQERDEP